MTRFSAAALPILSLFAARSAAWGQLGHETVGEVAQNFLKSETKQWAQNILGITNSSYLSSVASWADSFKYTSEGAFSSPLHYIDAEDDPPKSCNVDYDRDCGSDGCVVAAIANYTSRVQDKSLDDEQVQQALKFLVHFIGDIHQPLHDESTEVGGNLINVTFQGEDTNLHSTWDTAMPEKLIGGYTISYAHSWGLNLSASIKTGKWKSQKNAWLDGIDVNDAKASSMDWANDANQYVCSTALAEGVDALEGDELYPAYYRKAIPVIDLMIAKAGYRLAAWHNLIATGSTGLKGADETAVARHISAPIDLPKRDGSELISEARIKRMAFGSDCNCGHKH